MKEITLLELLKNGVHFGHQTARWHPKMKAYIFSSRNGVYIIDLEQTKANLERAYAFVRDTVAKGGEGLFVATKRQAKPIAEKHAQRVGAAYVTERWIGGTFTNFATINRQLKKMKQYKSDRDTGVWDKKYKKHEQLVLQEEIDRLDKLMGGFADMDKLPSFVFIVDLKHEKTAVLEAQKMKIPIVAMVDTNVNPEFAAYPIPANDDATKSIELIVGIIADAVAEGRELRAEQAAVVEKAAEKAKEQKAEPEPTLTPVADVPIPAPTHEHA